VRLTQRAIKQALTERYYAWRDAEVIAKDDPEIDLSGNVPIYTPSEYFEEPELEEAGSEPQLQLEQPASLETELKPEQRPPPGA
jgi:large subunit ribosomal protein L47